MKRLQNKTGFISGGTSGIGFETAKRFIEEGATVIITGRFKDTVDGAVAQLGKGAYGIVSDTSKMSDVFSLKKEITAIVPALDIVFINAGYGRFAPVESVSEQVFDELFTMLVKGAFFTAQTVLPLVSEGGTVIFNTSVVTQYGSSYASVYSAAKSAVSSFVKTFAAELISRGIRVNGISPGYTSTNGFQKTGMSEEQINEVIQSVTSTLPFKRFGRSSEIANAVAFLASDEASYLHGTELIVDGGYTVIK